MISIPSKWKLTVTDLTVKRFIDPVQSWFCKHSGDSRLRGARRCLQNISWVAQLIHPASGATVSGCSGNAPVSSGKQCETTSAYSVANKVRTNREKSGNKEPRGVVKSSRGIKRRRAGLPKFWAPPSRYHRLNALVDVITATPGRFYAHDVGINVGFPLIVTIGLFQCFWAGMGRGSSSRRWRLKTLPFVNLK